MQLFVKGVQQKGSNRSTFTINDFNEKDTVRSLKLVISNKFCIPYNIFYMVVGGKHLKEDNILEDRVYNESTIHIIFRAGGARSIVIKDRCED
tara:strand:+ start:6093 stop:6371 length:279 start_codon:yes stop_codon:yes gene_type:complete